MQKQTAVSAEQALKELFDCAKNSSSTFRLFEIIRERLPREQYFEAMQVIAMKLCGMFPQDAFPSMVWQITAAWEQKDLAKARELFRRWDRSFRDWLWALELITWTPEVSREEREKAQEGNMLMWAALLLMQRGLDVEADVNALPSPEFMGMTLAAHLGVIPPKVPA